MPNELVKLLDYVKERRAIDFTAWRPAGIQRRMGPRLSATGSADYRAYLSFLQKNPRELDSLVDALTIKVSCFFRNPLFFEVLKNLVLPELLEAHKQDGLRIWCAGCARGEEPYSVAILIRELAGKESPSPNVFIIGTNIDEGALETAKEAVYRPESIEDVRKGHLDRYFVPENGQYRLKEEVRSMVAFARHDVMTGTGPREGVFSDYHLILCRNVLIYFSRSMHEKTLSALAGMVSGGGHLALGEAEALPPGMAERFDEVLPGTKLFRKRE